MARIPRRYRHDLIAASRKYGIDSHVLAGLVDVETGGTWRADLTSPVGARGLTQFMPGTARSHGVRYGTSRGATRSQLFGAAKYLRELGYRKGNRAAVHHALQSYNAGPGNPGAAGPYGNNVLGRGHRYIRELRGMGGYGRGPIRGGGGGTPGTPGQVLRTQGQFSRDPVLPGGQGLVSLLKTLREQEQQSQQPVSQGIQPPEFAAKPPTPEGYQSVESGPPPPEKTPLSELLEQVEAGQGINRTTYTPGQTTVLPGTPGTRGRGGGGGGRLPTGVKDGGGWHGTRLVALTAGKGFITSGKRTPQQNAAVGGAPGSDHLTTNRSAYAVDMKFGVGGRVARRLGIRNWRPGTYQRYTIRIGGRRYSIQILERVKGHFDHTHLGVRRIG